MIGGRFVGFPNSRTELLGIDNLRLFGLSKEDGIVERFAFADDRDVFVRIEADRDGRMA